MIAYERNGWALHRGYLAVHPPHRGEVVFGLLHEANLNEHRTRICVLTNYSLIRP